jgi:REP element-mobilizing transposase RayT
MSRSIHCPENYGDYRHYIDLLTEFTAAAGTEVWAYCLMPNHVHLVLVPRTQDGLRGVLGEVHRPRRRSVNCPRNSREFPQFTATIETISDRGARLRQRIGYEHLR